MKPNKERAELQQMKNQNKTVAETTVLRPVESIIREKFVVEGNRMSIKPGESPTFEELRDVLENRVTESGTFYTQACFALNSASQQANGKTLVDKAIGELKKSMNEKQVNALKDDALNTIPFMLAYAEFAKTEALPNADKLVVSVAKDMRAAFKWNEDKTAILPLKDQTKAVAKLAKEIKALPAGKMLSQNKIRKIRASLPKKDGGNAKAESAGSTQKTTGTKEPSKTVSVEEKAIADVETGIVSLANAMHALTSEPARLHATDAQKAVVDNLLVQLCKAWNNYLVTPAGSSKALGIKVADVAENTAASDGKSMK